MSLTIFFFTRHGALLKNSTVMRIISGTIVPAKLAPEPTAVTTQFWSFNIVKHNEQFRKKNSKKRMLLSL